jgi:2-hydroxyacyl-CoA lyase 1
VKTVSGIGGPGGLRSWHLGWELGYEKLAEACGGKGFLVRTSEELHKATIEGYHAKVPCIVNAIIDIGKVEKPVSHLLRTSSMADYLLSSTTELRLAIKL